MQGPLGSLVLAPNTVKPVAARSHSSATVDRQEDDNDNDNDDDADDDDRVPLDYVVMLFVYVCCEIYTLISTTMR